MEAQIVFVIFRCPKYQNEHVLAESGDLFIKGGLPGVECSLCGATHWLKDIWNQDQ